MAFFHEHTMKPPVVVVYSMMESAVFYTLEAAFLLMAFQMVKIFVDLRLSQPSRVKLCYNKKRRIKRGDDDGGTDCTDDEKSQAAWF